MSLHRCPYTVMFFFFFLHLSILNIKLNTHTHTHTANTSSGPHSHPSENMHLWSPSEHKATEHQNRLGQNASITEHRTTSEHRSVSSEHRSHHSDMRGHSREPLKESRSRPPSQQSSKASPANSTHSGYSPIRKDKEKDISPFSDEDLVRSSGGRYESSKKWPHPEDTSHSKHKRPHGKKRPNVESPSLLYSKKHHRDERPTSGHRSGGLNPEWKNERGQGSSRGGTPERKEKRVASHHHHLPSSDSLLHDSGIMLGYGRDGPTFNGKGDLRRRSYESISDEDMSFEVLREGSQEKKSLYDSERLSKKERKKRPAEFTDSSEDDHHTIGGGTVGGDSRTPASSVMSGGSLGTRTKHKKHKYSKEHKETWRKTEHSKEGSGGNKHKHSHYHHKR